MEKHVVQSSLSKECGFAFVLLGGETQLLIYVDD